MAYVFHHLLNFILIIIASVKLMKIYKTKIDQKYHSRSMASVFHQLLLKNQRKILMEICKTKLH